MSLTQQQKVDLARAKRGAMKGFSGGLTRDQVLAQYGGAPAQELSPAVQPEQATYQGIGQVRPQTGLIGAETAIGQGFDGAMGQYNNHYQNAVDALSGSSSGGSSGGGKSYSTTGYKQTYASPFAGGRPSDRVSAEAPGSEYIDSAIANYQPYQEQGGLAYDKVAALSGALGQDAQQGAYDQFTESPGQAWLREQGERAVTRNAAATGNLGGGRVLQELQRQGQGLAAQDFDNYYNRLAALGESGMAANNAVAGLSQAGAGNATSIANTNTSASASMANAATAAAASRANAKLAADTSLKTSLANTYMNWGNNTAKMTYGTGDTLAGLRTDAGNNIAQGHLGVGQAIGNGQYQAATDGSNIIGGATNNLGNILSGAAGANANGWGQVASGLSGVNGQVIGGLAGTNNVNNPQWNQGTLANVGNALGGIGSFAESGAGSAIMGMLPFSDPRLKTNIQKIGETSKGFNLYTWDWNEEGKPLAAGQPTIGVMADEMPDEYVVRGDDGYLRVDYSKVYGG